ncbi:MAG: hypothetical protein N3A66_05550 [Planctomycetota bacterium]|nr:hypothetical protein [Planctomycetota bacterium]
MKLSLGRIAGGALPFCLENHTATSKMAALFLFVAPLILLGQRVAPERVSGCPRLDNRHGFREEGKVTDIALAFLLFSAGK